METWKDIPNYEGLYQISDLGNARSLDKKVRNHLAERTIKGRLLKGSLNKNGYRQVVLTKNGKIKAYYIHQLVAMAFLGHKPNGYNDVIDHIDRDRLNNNLENLRITDCRENSNNKSISYTSKYRGVSKKKNSDNWTSYISLNGKNKNLGTFKSELRASTAYELALLQLDKLEKILA